MNGETQAAARGTAGRIIAALAGRGQTLAVAESLTGGLLGAAVTEVPGASAVFRGGIIAYATDLKAVLLGVPVTMLDERGAVDAGVAAAMADGVRERLGADVGAATTGVAGPEPAEGKPPGTVHIAVSTAEQRTTRTLSLPGDRAAIRHAAVTHALGLLWSVLREESG